MRRFAFLALLGLSVLPGVALAQDASNPPQSPPVDRPGSIGSMTVAGMAAGATG